jgi:hypothetical protein
MPFGGFSVVVTFRNHKALFLWAFMALYIGLVAAMSYVLIRHGPPEGYSVASTITIMTVLWIGGIGGTIFVSNRPCVTLKVEPNFTVHILHRYPLRTCQLVVDNQQIELARVVETLDSNGDRYFIGRASLIDGTSIDFIESHHSESCEAVCKRFNHAVFGIATAARVELDF